jgi:hypothetical protein
MKYFLAFWCAEGIEHLEEITHAAPENTDMERAQARLMNEEFDDPAKLINQRVSFLCMRGRYNPQRQYELWGFRVDDSVEFDDIQAWADTDPQNFVDWVRLNGTKFLDDRHMEPRRAIL